MKRSAPFVPVIQRSRCGGSRANHAAVVLKPRSSIVSWDQEAAQRPENFWGYTRSATRDRQSFYVLERYIKGRCVPRRCDRVSGAQVVLQRAATQCAASDLSQNGIDQPYAPARVSADAKALRKLNRKQQKCASCAA